jgi:hypothetical protein
MSNPRCLSLQYVAKHKSRIVEATKAAPAYDLSAEVSFAVRACCLSVSLPRCLLHCMLVACLQVFLQLQMFFFSRLWN